MSRARHEFLAEGPALALYADVNDGILQSIEGIAVPSIHKRDLPNMGIFPHEKGEPFIGQDVLTANPAGASLYVVMRKA